MKTNRNGERLEMNVNAPNGANAVTKVLRRKMFHDPALDVDVRSIKVKQVKVSNR